jgi:hypothetical protein
MTLGDLAFQEKKKLITEDTDVGAERNEMPSRKDGEKSLTRRRRVRARGRRRLTTAVAEGRRGNGEREVGLGTSAPLRVS